MPDHRILISQKINGQDRWTILLLREHSASLDGRLIAGRWTPTTHSYNGDQIKLTSDHVNYLFWEFRQPNARGGSILIGSRMARASHHADQKDFFQVLVTLYAVKRIAGRKFSNGSVLAGLLAGGAGALTYKVDPHFEKGHISWEMGAYVAAHL
jgi:hypothetical protein